MSGRFGFFSPLLMERRGHPAARPYPKVSLATSCKDPARTETPREREEKKGALNALTFRLPLHTTSPYNGSHNPVIHSQDVIFFSKLLNGAKEFSTDVYSI